MKKRLKALIKSLIPAELEDLLVKHPTRLEDLLVKISAQLEDLLVKIPAQLEDLLVKNRLEARASPDLKVAQRQLFNYYQHEVRRGRLWDLGDTGFRNYSQFEEDGILLYIFAAIGATNKTFVDIGAGDGINSNCANLAINFGWNGLFIDENPSNIDIGRSYYDKHPDTQAYPPNFIHAFVHRENINEIIEEQGICGEIDFVSIDIDGNDYWIWDALSIIQPRVIIIETHVEFGLRRIVVPYDKDYHYPGKHPDYHGASPVAMVKLARKKGYRLVGSNLYGFNTIYVRQGIGQDVLPEVTVESILSHPRNKEKFKLFEPIKDWKYIEV